MSTWIWALIVVAALIAFGWVFDARTRRRLGGFTYHDGGASRHRVEYRLGDAERVDPGFTKRDRIILKDGSGGGGFGGGDVGGSI
jgi:hypothetical protein